MTWEMTVELVGFIVAMIAICAPIAKLNMNISRLNTTIEILAKDTQEKHSTLNKRVSKHGEQIDELEKVTVNHEVRINAIEKEKKE